VVTIVIGTGPATKSCLADSGPGGWELVELVLLPECCLQPTVWTPDCKRSRRCQQQFCEVPAAGSPVGRMCTGLCLPIRWPRRATARVGQRERLRQVAAKCRPGRLRGRSPCQRSDRLDPVVTKLMIQSSESHTGKEAGLAVAKPCNRRTNMVPSMPAETEF